jgi:hypothetical protein
MAPASVFGVAVAAVMLVAGEFYFVTQPDPPETHSQPPAVIRSSIEKQPP